MNVTAFTPQPGGVVAIAATTTSASGTLSAAGAQANHICIWNPGTTPARIRFSKGAADPALATDYAIAPSSKEIIGKPIGYDTVNVKMDTGTATVEFTPGEGI